MGILGYWVLVRETDRIIGYLGSAGRRRGSISRCTGSGRVHSGILENTVSAKQGGLYRDTGEFRECRKEK